MDVRRLVRDERTDFAAFLATLSPEQWQAPALCAGWRVRDVVAHVISYDNPGSAQPPRARRPGPVPQGERARPQGGTRGRTAVRSASTRTKAASVASTAAAWAPPVLR